MMIGLLTLGALGGSGWVTFACCTAKVIRTLVLVDHPPQPMWPRACGPASKLSKIARSNRLSQQIDPVAFAGGLVLCPLVLLTCALLKRRSSKHARRLRQGTILY